MKTIPTHLACLALGLAALNILPAPARAQPGVDKAAARTSETTGPKRFWQASLSGGSYMVALDRITSISKHTYLVDGNIAVTEVVIDTSGSAVARFYCLGHVGQDASGIGERSGHTGKQLPDKAGQGNEPDLGTAAGGGHPTTTRAKTVQFRVSDPGDLDQLLNSVRNAWVNGKGRKFTIKADD